jgi:hypothetical protein
MQVCSRCRIIGYKYARAVSLSFSLFFLRVTFHYGGLFCSDKWGMYRCHIPSLAFPCVYPLPTQTQTGSLAISCQTPQPRAPKKSPRVQTSPRAPSWLGQWQHAMVSKRPWHERLFSRLASAPHLFVECPLREYISGTPAGGGCFAVS